MSPLVRGSGALPKNPSEPARKRKYRLTARALAARRANFAKARLAPKEIIYRPSEKRRAASRANLAKAIAARKSPKGNAAARMNALKHGLFAREVEASVRRLGESPQEFRAHRARFERCFFPQDEVEKQLVERLAFTVWRRLRLFRGQARWESVRVKKLLDAPPPGGIPLARATAASGHALGEIFYNLGDFFDQLSRLQCQVESVLRALVRKRSGGAMDFKVYAPRRESRLTKPSSVVGELIAVEIARRLAGGSGRHD